jgi:hypothetical protein
MSSLFLAGYTANGGPIHRTTKAKERTLNSVGSAIKQFAKIFIVDKLRNRLRGARKRSENNYSGSAVTFFSLVRKQAATCSPPAVAVVPDALAMNSPLRNMNVVS